MQNQESKPSAKEANNLKMGLRLNIKIKKECDVFLPKCELFEDQHVYYFLSKNHIFWNPNIPMCGPFFNFKNLCMWYY